MNTLETHFAYLPLPYRIAIERIDADSTRRGRSFLRELCDGYARAYGVDLDSDDHRWACDSADGIARRRFHDYDPDR